MNTENQIPSTKACDFSECNTIAPIIKSLKVEGEDVFIDGKYHGKKKFMTDTELVFKTPLGKEMTISFLKV